MLAELSIQNLGVIESVNLVFTDGFSVVTGETGAGKTMIVEAINLVVGKRADATVVRDGEVEARVEARFVTVSGDGEVETILCRVVEAAGRSRAYVNGRMSTVAVLAEMGATLVDIHGQHAHQRLLSPSAQREALDSFGSVDLSALNEAREEVTAVDALLAALGGDEKSRAREMDLLRFQCAEIEGAQLSDASEDLLLEREEDLLADIVRHKEMMWEVGSLLSADDGVLDLLGRAAKAASGVRPLDDLHARLVTIVGECSDVASELRSRVEELEENPLRLDEVRRRRQVLRELKKKYGDSLADVMQFGSEARSRLDELEGYAERVQELEARRSRSLSRLEEERRIVGDRRRSSAPLLGEAVQKRLASLDLPHATLTVSVGDPSGDPAGDAVSFMFAANPGLNPQPLGKVASGGELARVMLALRLALTEDPATMVFDEVDAGIGGSAAVAVAHALRELGGRHQVFAVTHLAQVAAAAHHQFAVSKEVIDGRTFGHALVVDGEARASEIGRMLSGGVADESAVAHARELLSSFAGNADSCTP